MSSPEPTSRPPKGTALNLKANAVRSGLGGFDVRHGGLAAAAVYLGVKRDLLALDQHVDAGALKRGGMNKHVFAAVFRLDEAKPFCAL